MKLNPNSKPCPHSGEKWKAVANDRTYSMFPYGAGIHLFECPDCNAYVLRVWRNGDLFTDHKLDKVEGG